MANKDLKETALTNANYELKIGKVSLSLTNQNKIYWPDEKITKGDLVSYYYKIAPFILPYLKDRPQSLHRFPNGIKAPAFYQKDLDTAVSPAWLRTESILAESTNEHIDYLICNDKATLVYMANLGCIEINPWNSRLTNPDKPDWLVIDLDPEEIAFTEVVRTAQTVKKVCDSIELPCYCKTSGATGLHIFIPTGGRYNYASVRDSALMIAQHVHALLPDITSLERQPKKRKGKVYLDYLQNSKGQTLAAPYSARPKPGATVSTPLKWEEVNSKLSPAKFTIQTIFKRLDKTGDLWKGVLGKDAGLQKAIERLPNV